MNSEVNTFLETVERRIFWIRQHLYIPNKGFFELSFWLFGWRGRGLGHWIRKPRVYYCSPFLVIPFICRFTFAFNKDWKPYYSVYEAPYGDITRYEKNHWLIKLPGKLHIDIHGIEININWGWNRCH